MLGVLLIPPSAYFGVYSYIIVQAIQWSQQSLKCGPIFVLFLLTLGNLAVRRLKRRFALTPAELILVYAMLVTATAVGGIGMVQFLVTGLPAPYTSRGRATTGATSFRSSLPSSPRTTTTPSASSSRVMPPFIAGPFSESGPCRSPSGRR
jgi:hypothetical protein